MLRLPARFAGIIIAFTPLFVHRSWQHAQVLLLGAILAPGQRTVASLLRIAGLSRERHFVNYHRVLSRAAWSSRAGARILLGLLVEAFVPDGPIVMAIDDTIERRRGRRITAKGIYRDPVRSSDAHFVKTSGLRWMSLMLLAPIPWAQRVWALPVLTALAPSERFCREQGRRHKTLLDWGRQIALQARRWLPGRDLILVTDSGFSALLFLDAMRRARITTVTRLRLDAALYEPAQPRLPGTIGRPRRKGARLPTLAEVRAAKSTHWQMVHVPGWYGAGERMIEIASAMSVWQHSGLPVVPIRWVLIRILKTASRLRRSSAPTQPVTRRRSWAGSCGAGRWRSPSRRLGSTSASRRSASGPTGRLLARRPASSRCSRL
jgi:DDE superfamily endonuclease